MIKNPASVYKFKRVPLTPEKIVEGTRIIAKASFTCIGGDCIQEGDKITLGNNTEENKFFLYFIAYFDVIDGVKEVKNAEVIQRDRKIQLGE